jgi:hypothetical protein
MIEKQIIEKAPDESTHVMGGNCYCDNYSNEDGDGDGYDYQTFINQDTTDEGHRSLKDMRRIAELERESEEKDKRIAELEDVIENLDLSLVAYDQELHDRGE